ncbi:GAP1-N2 domain-containing protein [Bifidobacterium criceti]|nr:hypothetical protein [Bifidobacterium criceti]
MMQAEQVIYTSCRQGIDGNASGFQNYSYSPHMHDWIAAGNGIGVMQSYTPPRRDDYPALPTKDEAQSLYPRRWCFGPLTGPDGLYGMAVCSYIGRDYPEGSVRGGNFISHTTALPAAQVDAYPCGFLSSPSFLTWMDAETARKDERPALLEPLGITPADGVTIDDVREFLDEDDHGEAAKLLLEALIADGDDDFSRKILINASEHDFALWIAAMQYALPIRQALTYGFSSYEYDPLRSPFHLIRAVDGMNGSIDSPALSYCDLFDVDAGRFPDREYQEGLDGFADFVITMLRYSQDGLDSFHTFLDATSYAALDAQLVTAYDLYRIMMGSHPVTELDAGQVAACGEFVLRYGAPSQRAAFAECLMDALTSDERPEAWCAAATGTVVSLTQDNEPLRAALCNAAVQACADIIANGVGSQRLYRQTHSVGERLFSIAGGDLDMELFHAIDGEDLIGAASATGVSGTQSQGVPWTFDVYASMVTSVMFNQLDKGLRLPLGVPGCQMVAAFQGDVPAAILRLIDTATAQPDFATGVAMVEMLIGRWNVRLELIVMLSLLVIERRAAMGVEQAAIGALERVFATSATEGRVYCCKALMVDRRGDIVNRFADGLASRIDICDGTASARAANDVCELCGRLGLPIPNVVVLAQQQAAIAQLSALMQQRKPDAMAVQQALRTVSAQGARLPISDLDTDNQRKYLAAIAQPLATCVTDSVDIAAVQLNAVPAMFIQPYMRHVFAYVIVHNDAANTLTLLALDAAMLNAKPETGQAQVERFADIVGDDMTNNANVHTNNLVKLVDDPKRKAKFVAHYEKSLGKRFPERAFAAAWGRIAPKLGPRQAGGVFGFFTRKRADK